MYGQHTKQLEEAYLKNVYQKLIDKKRTAGIDGYGKNRRKPVVERNGWRASIEF